MLSACGRYGHIAYHDFVDTLGPGGDEHGDGIVRRYVEARVTRVPDVPGHLALDRTSAMLYVADTGSGRVMRLDTASGAVAGPADEPAGEPLAEYSKVEGLGWQVLIEGLAQPSGLALADDRLFVGDHATGEIIAFDLAGTELGRIATGALGLMGLAIGPDARLYYIDAHMREVVRIDRLEE